MHCKCLIVKKLKVETQGIIPIDILLELPVLVRQVALLIVNIYFKFPVAILNGSRDITKCDQSCKKGPYVNCKKY